MASSDISRPLSKTIEDTLELERQLDLETETPQPTLSRPQSLDPRVLASLVISLTAERDSLLSALDASKEREDQLRAELHRHLDRVATQDEELEALRHKSEEAEESIALLRSKVEDSRRALMRLQTENRRGHNPGSMSVDLSRSGSFSFGGPLSAKRTSFAPLAGSPRSGGHSRRPSNISAADANFDTYSTRPRPNGTIDLPPVGPSVLSTHASQAEYSDDARNEPHLPVARVDIALHGEIQALKDALEETRGELTEAIEAKEASDTCVKALRDFITQHNIGTSTSSDTPQVTTLLQPPAGPKSTTDINSSRWTLGGLWRTAESSKGQPIAPTSPPESAHSGHLSKTLGAMFGSRQAGMTSTEAVSEIFLRETSPRGASSFSESPVIPVDLTEPARPASTQIITCNHSEPEATSFPTEFDRDNDKTELLGL